MIAKNSMEGETSWLWLLLRSECQRLCPPGIRSVSSQVLCRLQAVRGRGVLHQVWETSRVRDCYIYHKKCFQLDPMLSNPSCWTLPSSSFEVTPFLLSQMLLQRRQTDWRSDYIFGNEMWPKGCDWTRASSRAWILSWTVPHRQG